MTDVCERPGWTDVEERESLLFIAEAERESEPWLRFGSCPELEGQDKGDGRKLERRK